MMRVFIGFDDTDNPDADRGTGKLARWFESRLPPEARLWGVVRQQLLVHESIPYTSHNSSACVVVDIPDRSIAGNIFEQAVSHAQEKALEGSNAGVCMAWEGHDDLPLLHQFGLACTSRVVKQKDALQAARSALLFGDGITHDGIIGAAAAVGLTTGGWSGRFIEFGGLRDFPERVMVEDLERSGMLVVSVDRNAKVPAPEDTVHTNGWLRPRLWGYRAVLSVVPAGDGAWISLGRKRRKREKQK